MSVLAELQSLQAYPAQRDLALRLEALFLADPRIEAVALKGSVARGSNDRFSDLDFNLIVREEYLEELLAERLAVFQQAGNLAYWFISATMAPRIFVGVYDDLVEVNAVYQTQAEVQPHPGDGQWLVLKDTTGWLSLVAEEAARQPLPAPPMVDRPDDKFWLWVFRTLYRVERGELWHAWGMLDDVRRLLISELLHVGRKPYLGLKELPRSLDRADERWLAKTVCALEPGAILNALSAAVGLYTAVRARSGREAAQPQLENQIKRMLQSALSRQQVLGERG